MYTFILFRFYPHKPYPISPPSPARAPPPPPPAPRRQEGRRRPRSRGPPQTAQQEGRPPRARPAPPPPGGAAVGAPQRPAPPGAALPCPPPSPRQLPPEAFPKRAAVRRPARLPRSAQTAFMDGTNGYMYSFQKKNGYMYYCMLFSVQKNYHQWGMYIYF